MTARWILTWKLKAGDGKPSWGVKARLGARGYEDFQKFTVESCSPTSSRTAQGMLMSLSARKRWELLGYDISTAFLQGKGNG